MAKLRLFHALHQFLDKRQMAAGQNGQANNMGAVILRLCHQFFGGHANTVIGDVHTAVTGPEGDLFGAI